MRGVYCGELRTLRCDHIFSQQEDMDEPQDHWNLMVLWNLRRALEARSHAA